MGLEKMKVPTNFIPRPGQRDMLNKIDKNYAKVFCVIAHRRFGKDALSLISVIRMAVMKPSNYYLVYPNLRSGRRIGWDYKLNGESIWNQIPKQLIKSMDKTEMRIELVNGSVIQLIGVENGMDAIVGIQSKQIILSETSILPSSVWSYLLPIAVMDKDAQILMQGTIRPGSWINDLIDNPPDVSEISKDLHIIGLREMEEFDITEEEYLRLPLSKRQGISTSEYNESVEFYKDHVFLDSVEYSVADTGLINPVELELTRQSYIAVHGDEGIFMQEFFNSRSAVSSGIYGSQMSQAIKEGRLADWEYNPNYKLFASLDLGINDRTVVSVAQLVGSRLMILDQYSSRDNIIDHYTDYINNYKYNIETVYLPHDSAKRNMENGRTTYEAYANKLPNKNVKYITRTASVENDIFKIREIFPNIYFNTSSKGVKDLTKELMAYDWKRQKTDDNISTGNKRGKPEHSDIVDSFRYLVLASTQTSTIRNLTS